MNSPEMPRGHGNDRQEGHGHEALPPIQEHEPGYEQVYSPEADCEREPRIYVASLTDYNNGILHGEWISAEADPEQLYAKTRDMLARSPTARRYGEVAEEWAIHDHDGFAGIRLGEHEDFATVSRLARGIVDHGPAFAAWVDLRGKHDDELDEFEDHYFGEYDSVRDYAEHILDDLGYLDEIEQVVPDYLKPYVAIDSSAFGRDLVLSGDIHVHENDEGKVWVFDGR